MVAFVLLTDFYGFRETNKHVNFALLVYGNKPTFLPLKSLFMWKQGARGRFSFHETCPPLGKGIPAHDPQLEALFVGTVEALLNKLCYWKWVLRVHSLAPFPAHSICFLHVATDVISELSAPAARWHFSLDTMDSPSGIVSTNKLFLLLVACGQACCIASTERYLIMES